jgi:predicted Rossmann fold nucleotide-binding protein DprA/Smf involved in DNA uptake
VNNHKEINMRLIIAGGRDFTDIDLMTSKLDTILSMTDDDPITILSGTARGADQTGEVYARIRALSVEQYPAEWDKYGKSAGYKRNDLMASLATHCVVFWDGQSKGSKHMIDLARAQGLELRIVRY